LDSAVLVLDKCMELTPNSRVPFDLFVPPVAEGYYNCQQNEKANAIVTEHLNLISEELVYYFSLNPELRDGLDYEIRVALQLRRNTCR